MKKTMALAAFMLMSNAFAQTCLERVCVGDTVMDSSNNVGAVVGIVDSKLIYRVGTSEYRANPSGLSKETADTLFYKGAVVIDRSNNIGTVVNAFEDKRVRYSVSGYYYVANNLSYQVSQYDDLSSGVEVIDQSNNIGTVAKTFSDGRTQYVISGYNYITNSTALSKKIESIDGLKAESSIIDTSDNIGVVKKIFKNAKVQYNISGYNYITYSNKLSLEVSSLGELTPNTNIIDTSDNIGTVKRLFANGRIQYNVSGYNYMTNPNKLSVEVQSIDGLAASRVVIDPSNNIGVVKRLFKNSRVQYSVSGYNYMTNASSLSLENVGLGEIKTGKNILDSSNNIGVVRKTFDNKKVQYSVSGYNYITDVKKLAVEVDLHPSYAKDEEYAIGRFVGKAVHFFENGKTALENGSGYKSVGSELALKVPSLGRVSTGTILITSSGAEVKALNMFDNNTVEVEVREQREGEKEERVYKKGVTVILDSSSMEKQVLLDYANDIYRKHSFNSTGVFEFASLAEEVNLIKLKIADNMKEFKKYFSGDKKAYKKFLNEINYNDDSTEDGEVLGSLVEVKLNLKELESIVSKTLSKNKVNFVMTPNPQAVQTLDIKIERDRKFPLTKCSVRIEHVKKQDKLTTTVSTGAKKTVLGWGKKSCKSVVKKLIKDLDFR